MGNTTIQVHCCLRKSDKNETLKNLKNREWQKQTKRTFFCKIKQQKESKKTEKKKKRTKNKTKQHKKVTSKVKSSNLKRELLLINYA